ncbi:MAG: hypothetical protein ACQKBT_04120, partial [Puniceicoccales bacterium]
MRKFLRWLAVAVILLILLVGVMLIPAVQKSIFLTVASGEDRSISVDYLHLGPGGLKVENLEFAGSGILARVPQANARFSWGALLKKRLILHNFEATDLFVKIESQDVPAADREDSDAEESFKVPKDFAGLLGTPFPLELERISVTGQLSTPGNDEIDFVLSGGGIAPGEKGQLNLGLTPREGAMDTLPGVQASIPVEIDGDGNLAGLALQAEVTSRVPDVQGVLDIDGSVLPAEEGESYRISVTSEELLA